MKIEYIQNVNAVQSLSDLIMELRIACFGKHLKKLDLDAGDATWLHQSCCCDHCVNHWGIDLCDCGSEHKVGECECGSQKAHDTLGIKYDSFGAILKNFG